MALDPYTDHGHDSVFDDQGRIENDRTVDKLVEQARILATAGCDIITPSDMMDGRVGAIREMLKQMDIQILSYYLMPLNMHLPFMVLSEMRWGGQKTRRSRQENLSHEPGKFR